MPIPSPSQSPSSPKKSTQITNLPSGSQMSFRFQVQIESVAKEFSERCVSFAMNLVAKEFVMAIESSASDPTREHVVIQDWIDNPGKNVTLEILDTKLNVAGTIEFTDCEIIDHVCEYTMINIGTVMHIVALKYTSVDFGSGSPMQLAYANAMSIVGKP